MADAIAGRAQARPAVSVETVVERARAWLPLAAVVAVFFLVASTYNTRVPLYEAPDEVAHAYYAAVILERGELPRFEARLEYESHQPPLYYAVGAAALKLMALDPPPALNLDPALPGEPNNLNLNPAFPGEPNNYIHTAQEGFPYSQSILAVHVLRGISTLFSLGTLIFIYLTATALFPDRKMLAFTAAATAGLIPQFAYISGTVNNDPASVFFASATVYYGIRLLRDERQVWLVLAALALSLGALTKLTTLAAGAVPLGAVLLDSQPWSKKFRHLALLAFAPLALAGWFYLRSLILWGTTYPAHLLWPQLKPPIWDPVYRTVFLADLRESFWYRGGPMILRLEPILYDLLDVISVLGLGGVIATFRRDNLPRFQKRALFLLSILPVVAVASLLYFSLDRTYLSQGRYLFVAMPAFAILLPLGLSALFSRQAKDSLVMLALPALLLALNLGVFAITLPGAY